MDVFTQKVYIFNFSHHVFVDLQQTAHLFYIETLTQQLE